MRPRAADVPVDQIDRCRFQPRQEFPAEEIEALAATIADQGQLHPIAVRPCPDDSDRYELVDGERRLRAVKSLGWKTIRAEIGQHSDAQVRALVLVSAVQRKELNAIEEARAFRAMLDAGDAAGPSELAAQLGLSQGHVSNRLRLLELPEKFQQRVISREIPPTHARSIVRYKDSPTILKAIDGYIKSFYRNHGGLPSAEAFDKDVNRTAHCETRPMTGTDYSSKLWRNIPVFKPTDEQREQLGVIEVGNDYMPKGQDKPELRATNVKLWDKLQGEHEARLVEKAEKRKGGSGAAGPGKKPLTAAEKKRAAEEEKRKTKERAKKLARGIWAVAIDWRRWLISETLRGNEIAIVGGGLGAVGVAVENTLRLLLYFAASRDWRHWDCDCSLTKTPRNATERFDKRELMLWNGLVSAGVCTGGFKTGRPNLLIGMRACPDEGVIDRAAEFLAEMFWNDKFGPQEMPDAAILEIAELLGIDLATAWQTAALGPLTERWLDLRNKEQLVELAKQWKVEAAGGKTEIVAALAKIAHRQKPPAELLKPKKPK